MLNPFVEYQRSLFAPWTAWAEAIASAWIEPGSRWFPFPAASCFAAGWDMLNRFGKPYEKPAFGIRAVNGG